MNAMVKTLNQLPADEAQAAFIRCCGASRWASRMVTRRPYPNLDSILQVADDAWSAMEHEDFLEAFSHHPKIGASLESLKEKFAPTKTWSSNEQESVASASDETILALRDGNVAYEERYGFIFIVCATGKSAEEMLEILNSRMHHAYDEEIRIAAKEQAKITRLRLEKLEL